MSNQVKTYLNYNVQNGYIRRWNLKKVCVYIEPCQDSKYIDMVSDAFQLWLDETKETLAIEYVEDLFESHINIAWCKPDKENFGNCQFYSDAKSHFFSAEINIALPDYSINKEYDDKEVFYAVLKLTGLALGLPNSPYKGDITYEPHQYGSPAVLSERDKLSIKWLYKIKPELSVAEFAKRLHLDENTNIDDIIAFWEKDANYMQEYFEEQTKEFCVDKDEDTFDADEFITDMSEQAKELTPDDINQGTKYYLSKTIANFLSLAYDAIQNDNEFNLSANDKAFFLQLLAEWTFHKIIDLSRSKITINYWDEILQKIAFTIFEIVKECYRSGLDKASLLLAVEKHVNKSYQEALKSLLEKKKITLEVFLRAVRESNCELMRKNNSNNEETRIDEIQETNESDELVDAGCEYEELTDYDTGEKSDFENLQEQLGVDVLRLDFSTSLLSLIDPDIDCLMLREVRKLRKSLVNELGYLLPSIRILENVELEPDEYRILVREQAVCSGFVYPNKYMVLADEWDAKVGDIPENKIFGFDSLYNSQCYWLDKEAVSKYPNITSIMPQDVILEHIKYTVIKYVDSILTTCDIEKYIERVKQEEHSEKLLTKLQERLEPENIRKVITNLIREQVSVKDIILLFDKLCDYSKLTKNPNKLSEMIRADFAQQISRKFADDNEILYVVEFDEQYTKFLENHVKNTTNGQQFQMPKEQLNDLIETTAMKLMMSEKIIQKQPVVLCSKKFRQALYKTLVGYIPSVIVMSYAEIVSGIRVESFEIIEASDTDCYSYSEENTTDDEFYEQEPLLGRVIDSSGNPLDGEDLEYSLDGILAQILPADSSEPAPITKIFKTGVRAVDAFTTIGYGQKMGVFAQSGCGLSTFLSLVLMNSQADINIVSLAANSVENAWGFINDCIKDNPNVQRKTVVVCSTPLDSAEKIKKNFETAISLCEYFRDKGKNVLFISEKLEPILDAVEKLAWESGEPASENDYRLAVTSWFQGLINRCKNNYKGTITTILAVNMLQANSDDKALNIIRTAIQCHIFLSREVAEQNIYPAIDILGSISRFHIDHIDDEHKKAAYIIRKILAIYREKAEFFNSDKYVFGENIQNDFIAQKYDEIISFINQRTADNPTLEETFQGLLALTVDVDNL